MNARERRRAIMAVLEGAKDPVSGSALAREVGVSRQVVVQDIALLRAELFVHPADDASRLAGSGLAIANAPWGLEDDLKQLLPWLAGKLAQSQGDFRLDWLIAD